jgi:hypothetical protein
VLVVAHVITTPALLGVAGATAIGAISSVDETLDEVAEDLRRLVGSIAVRLVRASRWPVTGVP